MRIKTRIQLGIILSLVLAATIALLLILGTRAVNKASREAGIADQVVKGVAELEILTYDAGIHPEERSLVQWRSRYDFLAETLTGGHFKSPGEETVAAQIFKDLELFKTVFSALTTALRNEGALGKHESAGFRELQDRLMDDLLVKSQMAISLAFQLQRQIEAKLVATQRRVFLLAMLILLTFTAAVVGISLWIVRSIGRPIAKLEKDTRIIGSGNLDHKVSTTAKDEIGELSRAFDKMTKGLKETTTSIVELNKEIDERKRAEEALRESGKEQQHLIQHLHAGVVVHASDTSIIIANEQASKLLGLTIDQMMGRTAIDPAWCFIHEDETPVSVEEYPVACVFATGLPIRDMVRGIIRPLTNDRAWVLVNAFPEFKSDGQIRQVVVTFVDITARKQAEEVLRESEEKYRLLIENATDAIFIAQDEIIKFANPKSEKMTGYSAEELAKIPFVDLIHPEDRDMVLERHLKRLKGEEMPSIYSFIILNKYGEELSVELNAVIINWEGRPATLNFLRDITAQKRLEAQLQQALKMEAMGTLAGGIAHDFNNLLMAIQGRTSIMLMKKDSSAPDFGHLKGIEDNVESAADLTRQLLGFARGGKYEVKTIDINELIKKQNRMFGRTKKEITIRGKYEKDLWSVEVDRGQIEQVLLNLYVNAWQAMPGGGDLYLETENVTLDESYVKPFSIKPGRYVKISVTDTGVGMDKATRERIFEPFFTTKEMGRGTGLGLASAYGIIKNHGGFINVYSEKGHGTTFNICLPASEKEVTEEKKSAGGILRGSETVLFVDDEDMIIEVAKEVLEHLGYKVLTAGSGKEAIETYEKNKDHIDMVLLDMIMPDMSGSDTYNRMKEIDPDVKVLLSSGYSINGQATEIMDRGCNGFIQKPFKMKELSQKLREILDKK